MNNSVMREDMYSKEERTEMLVKMRRASAIFYGLAVQTHCHSFIEFTGFMNEFIKLCEAAEEKGIDWTMSNVHVQGSHFPMKPHHAEYLGEKFGCIFAGTLGSDDKLMDAFIAAVKRG